MERVKIPRIEFESALVVTVGFFPPPLPPIDLAEQPKDTWIVRQRPLGEEDLCASAVEIAVGRIEMLRQGEMRFAVVRS